MEENTDRFTPLAINEKYESCKDALIKYKQDECVVPCIYPYKNLSMQKLDLIRHIITIKLPLDEKFFL